MENFKQETIEISGKTFNVSSSEILPRIKEFSELITDNERSKYIVKRIHACGFETPTPIQELATNYIVNKKHTIMQSPSGSGKTMAFVSSLLLNTVPKSGKRTIVLNHTKDLARQTYKIIRNDVLVPDNGDSDDHDYANDYTVALCIGSQFEGMTRNEKLEEMEKHNKLVEKADILVGTIGTIYSYFKQEKRRSRRGGVNISPDSIGMFIVDEADKIMSDAIEAEHMSKIDEITIKNILKYIPEECQKVFVSATFTDFIINECVEEGNLKDYTSILMESAEINLKAIKQYKLILPQVSPYDPYERHRDNFSKLETILDLYRYLSVERAFIFVNSRQTAENVASFMSKHSFKVDCIHGDMDNKTRSRKLEYLRNGDITALICTDVAGRGIDIQHANLVINYDMCKEVADYVHRIGRCGRYGRQGMAISFITEPWPNQNRRSDITDISLLEKIERELKITIEELPDLSDLNNL